MKRAEEPARLDAASDFVVVDGRVCFSQSFETVEDDDAFSRSSADVVDAGRSLLTADSSRGLSTIVHETIILTIGCSHVPLFVMVCGGRGRTLLSFLCVHSRCSAFVDIRTILHAGAIKSVLMCVSHNHLFSAFPSRIPRNTFTNKTKASINKMVLENRRYGEIRMINGFLCNKVIDLDGALERPNSSARGVFLWRRLGNKPSRKRPIIGHIDCFVQLLRKQRSKFLQLRPNVLEMS